MSSAFLGQPFLHFRVAQISRDSDSSYSLRLLFPTIDSTNPDAIKKLYLFKTRFMNINNQVWDTSKFFEKFTNITTHSSLRDCNEHYKVTTHKNLQTLDNQNVYGQPYVKDSKYIGPCQTLQNPMSQTPITNPGQTQEAMQVEDQERNAKLDDEIAIIKQTIENSTADIENILVNKDVTIVSDLDVWRNTLSGLSTQVADGSCDVQDLLLNIGKLHGYTRNAKRTFQSAIENSILKAIKKRYDQLQSCYTGLKDGTYKAVIAQYMETIKIDIQTLENLPDQATFNQNWMAAEGLGSSEFNLFTLASIAAGNYETKEDEDNDV